MQAINAIEVPSRRFGKYLVRSRLGAGAMSEVFLAEAIDEQGQPVNVALKLMKTGLSEEKFADEVDLMGLLSHPNLVRMIEHGVAFGRHFIALEFLIGGDLREVMDAHRRQRKSFPLPMALHVVTEVLKALAYFHTATTRSGSPLNLVHHDVNPANVFFSGKAEVKLGDFGVASSGHINLGPGAGIAVGKLSYLAPEQTRGEAATPAADLWSVAVMLHELVVGYHPFKHADPQQEAEPDEEEVMALIRAPRLTIPDYVDRPLATVITRGLTVDLRQRYRSAGEFAGPLFAYALDRNLLPQPKAAQDWLEGVLGLLI